MAAFDSVFVKLGDVGGPGVTETADGFAFAAGWDEGASFALRLTITEAGVEEDGPGDRDDSDDGPLLVDLRGETPRLTRLDGTDLDGDGRPDVLGVDGHEDAWNLLYADVTARDARAGGATGGVRVVGAGDADCDDADPWEAPDGWATGRCDGGVDVDPLDDDADGDGVVYIAVEEEGVKRTVREDAKSTSRVGAGSDPGEPTYANVVFERIAGGGGSGGSAPTYGGTVVDAVDPGSSVLYDVPVAGDDGAVAVFVLGSPPEPIEPITARGVGVVGGVRWTAVSFLRGLGVL